MVVTPTEAGSIGAASMLLLGFASRRLNLRSLWQCLLDTVKTTGMIFAIIVGAFIFNAFFAISRIPDMGANFMAALPIPSLGILIVILIFYIILGTFMDGAAILFLTMTISR